MKRLFDEIKVDKKQTEFILTNFNKKYIHDADYHFLELFKEIRIPGCFLDIGANIGQSACSIASAHPSVKIYSYEPDQLLKNNLEIVRRILNGRMNYCMSGIAGRNEKRIFYIPRYGTEYFTQEGSFCKQEAGSEESRKRIEDSLGICKIDIHLEEMEFETITLNHASIESYFIKIDTQGYERESLLGLQTIISAYRPVILMERGFDVKEILAILPDYEIWNYMIRDRRFVRNVAGDHVRSANVFLIHKEGTGNRAINHILRNRLVM